MEITIKVEPKEIADLVLAIQSQQNQIVMDAENTKLFGLTKGNAYDLIKKYNESVTFGF